MPATQPAGSQRYGILKPAGMPATQPAGSQRYGILKPAFQDLTETGISEFN